MKISVGINKVQQAAFKFVLADLAAVREAAQNSIARAHANAETIIADILAANGQALLPNGTAVHGVASEDGSAFALEWEIADAPAPAVEPALDEAPSERKAKILHMEDDKEAVVAAAEAASRG